MNKEELIVQPLSWLSPWLSPWLILAQANVRLMVDAEHSYFQPAIDHAAMELQRAYNRHKPTILNTYQCYLQVRRFLPLNEAELCPCLLCCVDCAMHYCYVPCIVSLRVRPWALLHFRKPQAESCRSA